MPARKAAPVRLRFKRGQAVKIARRYGHHTKTTQAEFYGVTRSAYSRVYNGVTCPGRDFIASALVSPAADVHPGFNFETLFEVVR